MDQPTTADNGLIESGWYPGKKHGFLKNLGRVASMGIYSPDNRIASHLNIKKLAQDSEANSRITEQLNTQRGLHKVALETLQDFYAKSFPEKAPEEITQMAARSYAQKFLTDEQSGRTKVDQDRLAQVKALGEMPTGKAQGLSQGNKNIATNKALEQIGISLLKRLQGGEAGQFDAGKAEVAAETSGNQAKDAENQNNAARQKAGAAMKYPEAQASADFSDVQQRINDNVEKGIEQTDRNLQRDASRGSTMQGAIDHSAALAAQAALQRKMNESMAAKAGDPTTADNLATAGLNQFSTQVPYGGTIVPVVQPTGTNVITGQSHNPNVTTVNTKIDPITGRPITSTSQRIFGGPTTADPISTPQGGQTMTVQQMLQLLQQQDTPQTISK